MLLLLPTLGSRGGLSSNGSSSSSMSSNGGTISRQRNTLWTWTELCRDVLPLKLDEAVIDVRGEVGIRGVVDGGTEGVLDSEVKVDESDEPVLACWAAKAAVRCCEAGLSTEVEGSCLEPTVEGAVDKRDETDAEDLCPMKSATGSVGQELTWSGN